MKEELKLEHLKLIIKRHFLSLPLQVCNNNSQFQGLKAVLEADRKRSSQHGKKLFSSHEKSSASWNVHVFQLCVCDMYMQLRISMILRSRLEENSLKELGGTTTGKTEGQSNTHEAWMLRPGGQKLDRHCFWKPTRFLFEVFLQSNAVPTNSQKKKTTPGISKSSHRSDFLSIIIKHTGICTEKTYPYQWLYQLCYMRRDGVFTVKCIFTILKLILFPFLTANVINQFIYSMATKCMHSQDITEHTLITVIIVMTWIQQST